MSDEPQNDNSPKSTIPVVVFSDFVCPYSYIGQQEMDLLMRDYDIEPVWRPHWLRPETPPEGIARPNADPERQAATLSWLQEMAPEMAAHMRFPDKLQFSFFAFQAMEYAQDRGKATPLRRAIFDALWLEGKDIGLLSTLQEAAEKAGLDPEGLARALYDEAYMERTVEAVESARRAGITGTPTVILGGTAIVGWHYYEVMQTVLEQQGVLPKSAASVAGQG